MLGCQVWLMSSLCEGSMWGRRKEPPRDESGCRAHGSNQRFHRLLRHAVARALTTAPSLAGVSPSAQFILVPQGWRRNEPPGTLSGNSGVARRGGGNLQLRVRFRRPRDCRQPLLRQTRDHRWRSPHRRIFFRQPRLQAIARLRTVRLLAALLLVAHWGARDAPPAPQSSVTTVQRVTYVAGPVTVQLMLRVLPRSSPTISGVNFTSARPLPMAFVVISAVGSMIGVPLQSRLPGWMFRTTW